ncbi:MAG: thioredoxin domain-containing protein [Elusimicrobiota bacterium]
MLPTTKSGRRLFAGAALLAATAALACAVRGKSTPYVPDAPAYRQKGPADAAVIIAEYSDFQCPACRVAAPTVGKFAQILFPGKVRIIFKHFPWDFHDWARDAAIAAECAGKGGDFWGFHDRLFARQHQWTVKTKKDEVRGVFFTFAKELKLDEAAFAACLDTPAVGEAVDAEFKEAKKRWVGSTPTFIINGRRFVGDLQLRTHGLNHIENILKGK